MYTIAQRMNTLKSRRIILSLIVIVFLMVSVGGVLSMGMTMHDGKMENCPFMGVTSICKMDVFEHLATWQNMFSSIPQQLTTFALLLLLSLFLLARFLDDFLRHKRSLTRPVFYRFREVEIFDPLRLAFARGLIHPKIF